MPLDSTDNPRVSLLMDAKDCLERVSRHERWDMSAQEYAYRASEYLRLAGLPDLADEAADEFGCDENAILAEIDRELQRYG